MQKTTLYLDPANYRRLKRLAIRRKRPPAALVREAVAEYVARHDLPMPKSLGAFRSGRGDLSERADALLSGQAETTGRRRRDPR
jgi:hypothetical protein